ncbi:MAG: DNA helicase RecQ [Bacteroidaceae bacterium]|nr:DNA helicase RecQ [Bacteroidaceae bacterium]
MFLTLKRYFGYESFRPQQREIIQHILEGGNALVLMPTGGGKSLCYQIPALMLPGLTIVVSPLISLMKDQVEALVANGIAARALNSSATEIENAIIRRECMEGKIKLLYISPERLMMELPILSDHTGISLFAIDEAHCISGWGHDFRPEYSRLGILHEQLPHVPIVALTATADKITRTDILEQLQIPDAKVFISSFDRPNLSLDVRRGLDARQKRQTILEFMNHHLNDCGIIYCMSQKNAEMMATYLCEHHITAVAYHAGLNSEERNKAQEDFINDRVQVVCATIAFGMGINKSNVRFVIHYNLPKSIENFYQEIGRAGRDGLPSDTLLFYSVADIIQLTHFAHESGQREINIERLSRMREYAEANICRRRILLNYFGEENGHDCGNCDVCKNPPQQFDGTVLIQKALSAISRTGEEITMRTTADILCGIYSPEVKTHGYANLKTYGVGRDVPLRDWNDYLLQMLQLGYVEIKYDEYNHLHITDLGNEVLYGHKRATLVVIRKEEKVPRRKLKKGELQQKLQQHLNLQITVEPIPLEDPILFEKLRRLRFELAERQGFPPYIILSDKVLHEIATVRPTTVEQFGDVSGIGEYKKQKYGQMFVNVVRQSLGLSSLSDSDESD